MCETEDSTSDVIPRPPKIYLDTNHLIYITHVRKGKELPEGLSEKDYGRLDERIKSCYGLIFNPVATMDWIDGKATTQGTNEIAAVFNSAKLKYTMPDTVDLIYTHEILDQCKKQEPCIHVPHLPPIPQNISDNSTILSPLHIIVNQVPDYLEENLTKVIKEQGELPNNIPVFSVGEWVNGVFEQRQQDSGIYQSRKDNFKRLFDYDVEHRDEYFRDPNYYRLEWIKNILKVDRILKALNPQIDVNDILEQIDIKECPAINLLWKCHETRMRKGKLLQDDNDVDDYMFIPVVPYADLMLIEKKFKGTIIQADNSLKSKVFSNVSDALNALKKGRFVW